MALNYVQEKFSQAVHLLATMPGPIKERLEDAGREVLRAAEDEGVPEGFRPDIEELKERLTKETGLKGSLPTTLAKMEQNEAVEIAMLIVALEYQLRTIKNPRSKLRGI